MQDREKGRDPLVFAAWPLFFPGMDRGGGESFIWAFLPMPGRGKTKTAGAAGRGRPRKTGGYPEMLCILPFPDVFFIWDGVFVEKRGDAVYNKDLRRLEELSIKQLPRE